MVDLTSTTKAARGWFSRKKEAVRYHVEEKLSDVEGPAVPANWNELDVSKFASRGMTLFARTENLSHKLYWPCIAVGLFAGYQIATTLLEPVVDIPHITLGLHIDPMPPAFLIGSATVEAAAAEMPSQATGEQIPAWVASYPPTAASLSKDNLDRLAEALRIDLSTHGLTVKAWDHVPKLAVPPMLTRAEKAIREHADRLKTGIVIIPVREPAVIPVVAHVAGQWSVSVFKGNACRTFAGPVPAGCEDRTAATMPSEAISIFKMIEPR